MRQNHRPFIFGINSSYFPACPAVINKLQFSWLTVSVLLKNIGHLDNLYREYEEPLTIMIRDNSL